MNDDTKYNGWANYETWNAALWLGNEQGSQEHCDDMARECLEHALENDESEPRDAAADAMAHTLESEHEDAAEEWMSSQTGFFADILNTALRNVNWHDIARHYVDEIEIYCAGWNMPGYMPDNPPAQFLDFDDARGYIAETIDEHRDQDEETIIDEDDNKTREAIKWVNTQTKDFTVNIGGYAYWVSKL